MRALVTGGTGFVGSNLVRELLADGHEVRVLARPGSDRSALQGCAVEIVEGDLLQRGSLERAVAGAEWVFHAAADYRLWAPDPLSLQRTNVEGTRNVLECAVAAGARRIVHTSTVGCLGLPEDGAPGDEDTPVAPEDMVGPYKASKFQAERLAEGQARAGAPVVIVNPSAPVGAWDLKPTPTGRIIVDFLRGRMLGVMDTGLNIVHVRDVARGHIRAAERGRVGEKYVLGNRNMSLEEIFAALAGLTGLPRPRLHVPYALALAAAFVMEGVARATGRSPQASRTAVHMAAKRMYFTPAKAWRELGLPRTPVETAFQDAVRFFVDRGYAPPPPRWQALAS